jgi:hypothetical protein
VETDLIECGDVVPVRGGMDRTVVEHEDEGKYHDDL